MLNYFQAIILGIVEGATEYLPISSTFHLIWSSRLLGLNQSEFQKLFEVFIQIGSIAAVGLIYFQTILKDRKLMMKVATSFIPTAVVGLLLYKVIKNVFFVNSWLQLAVFLIVGAVFILFERTNNRKLFSRDLSGISYKEAMLVGLVQALAVVPGVSRAGAVIICLMFLKFRRDEAARYSFLLALPTISAAALLDLVKMRSEVIGQNGNIVLLLIGTMAAFFSAMIVVKWLIKYLQNHSMEVFGWYRVALGILLLIFVAR